MGKHIGLIILESEGHGKLKCIKKILDMFFNHSSFCYENITN